MELEVRAFSNVGPSLAVWSASLIAEMKDAAEQNRRLKKMYAEMGMQNELLKEALGKKS